MPNTLPTLPFSASIASILLFAPQSLAVGIWGWGMGNCWRSRPVFADTPINSSAALNQGGNQNLDSMIIDACQDSGRDKSTTKVRSIYTSPMSPMSPMSPNVHLMGNGIMQESNEPRDIKISVNRCNWLSIRSMFPARHLSMSNTVSVGLRGASIPILLGLADSNSSNDLQPTVFRLSLTSDERWQTKTKPAAVHQNLLMHCGLSFECAKGPTRTK